MSSEPGVSSYTKIFGHLAECPEFKDVRVRWTERLLSTKFERYDFQYQSVYRGNEHVKEVVASFYATDGRTAGVYSDKGVETIHYSVEPDILLTDKEAEAVVKANFGTKRCRTYFCKVEKVIKGDERKNHRSDGFGAWARKKLLAETDVLVKEIQAAVVQGVRDVRLTDQFVKDKQRFFERQVIDEIKAVVLQYYDRVEPAVIKEALDEVVAHAVMES